MSSPHRLQAGPYAPKAVIPIFVFLLCMGTAPNDEGKSVNDTPPLQAAATICR